MYRRISLLLTVVITSIVCGFSYINISEVQRIHYEEVRSKLTVSANLIVFALESGGEKIENLDTFCGQIAHHFGGRVTFIDSKGGVVADSEFQASKMVNHFDREEVQKAYSGKIGTSRRYSTTLKKEMFYVAYPLKEPVKNIRVVRVSMPIKSVLDIIRVEIIQTVIVALIGIIIAVFLSRLFVMRIISPIQKLSDASVKIAEGQYGLVIMDNSVSEMKDLYKNFNKMSECLLMSRLELEENTVKIQAILTSMVNGIIALDNERRIMFVNPVAETVFGIRGEEVKGHHVLEIVRNTHLDHCLEAFLLSDVTTNYDIEIFKPVHKILSVSSNPIKAINGEELGIVLMVYDITEIRKLEQMRKDFVANVSHELKTPLTSIKGFVETLKDGAGERKEIREKFLDIIDIESARLKTLIDDLLLLSDIEHRAGKVAMEDIPVLKSVEEVLEMLEELARRKNIDLSLTALEDVEGLVGNTGWFKQMTINLVDNGIKYTPENGSVHVDLEKQDNILLLKVSDTGIGVKKEHLDRLFERFYRVDKARSRRVGGTGIGLAIVKHIALSMGGQIQVESELGKGTCFTVRLPLKKSST